MNRRTMNVNGGAAGWPAAGLILDMRGRPPLAWRRLVAAFHRVRLFAVVVFAAAAGAGLFVGFIVGLGLAGGGR